MLHAVIADDEYKVCQLIEQLGDWEQLGIEVAAVVNDGEEALDAIERFRPEIVVTDIRMPVYDGLELIRRTRKLGFNTEFIVISGYRQFEYAYGAIQYGVSDYLLKPVDQAQLNGALKKICEKFHQQDDRAEHEEKLERLETERNAWGERQFLSLLLEGAYLPDRAAQYRESYHVPLCEDLIYQAMFLNTSQPKLHASCEGFGEKVVETARQQFQAAAYFAAYSGFDGILLLVGYEPRQYTGVSRPVSQMFYAVRALRDFYGDFDLVIGLGKRVEGIGELGGTVESARSREAAKLAAGWNQIIETDSQRGVKLDGAGTWAEPERLRLLDDALDRFHMEETGAWFDQWQRHMERGGCFADYMEGRKAVMERLAMFYPEDRLFELGMQTDRARNGRDFIARLKAAALDGIREYLEAKEKEEAKPIRQAKEYIAQNYARPLTLEELADHVGFSAVYFSAMFKKLAGQSFADYLTGVRLDKAKKLLKESDLSILEISGAVGYGDNKYFRKLFKKETGMRPSDYRKLYQ